MRKENSDLSEDKLCSHIWKLRNEISFHGVRQSKLAKQVGLHKSTINKLFKKAQHASETGGIIDLSSKRKGKCGGKPAYQNSEHWIESCPYI